MLVRENANLVYEMLRGCDDLESVESPFGPGFVNRRTATEITEKIRPCG